jgi:hypothetical protein
VQQIEGLEMSENGYLEVKNWTVFQHYKKRSPPWIKLHRETLADYGFSRLHDASKAHLMLIWLLASESEGRVPNDPEWIAKRIGATGPVDLNSLVDAGFLVLERRKQSASERRAEGLSRGRDRDKEEKQGKDTWLTPFSDLWLAKCGAPPFGKLAKVLQPLTATHGLPDVLVRWERYLTGTEPKFCSVHRFAETFNSWAEPETVEMTDEWGAMRLHRRDPVSGAWVAVA